MTRISLFALLSAVISPAVAQQPTPTPTPTATASIYIAGIGAFNQKTYLASVITVGPTATVYALHCTATPCRYPPATVGQPIEYDATVNINITVGSSSCEAHYTQFSDWIYNSIVFSAEAYDRPALPARMLCA